MSALSEDLGLSTTCFIIIKPMITRFKKNENSKKKKKKTLEFGYISNEFKMVISKTV